MQIIIFIAMGSLNRNLPIFYQIRFIHKTLRNILLIQLPLVFLGLMIGDEILVINGKVVSELDMVYIENLLHTSQSLCCTIRSIHTQRSTSSQKSGEIDNMMCPPPPSQSRISEDTLGHLIVPSPAGKLVYTI